VTPYQVFLLVVLITWPFAILGLLYLMIRLENYVGRFHAETPREAGLEPIEGSPPEREVTIVFGDQVIGGAEDRTGPASEGAAAGSGGSGN
jgi:hypothetical protein